MIKVSFPDGSIREFEQGFYYDVDSPLPQSWRATS